MENGGPNRLRQGIEAALAQPQVAPVPEQVAPVEQTRQPVALEERIQIMARIAFNGVGASLDLIPGPVDPSLALDCVTTAVRMVSKVMPAVIRRKSKLFDGVLNVLEAPDVGWAIPATWALNGAEVIQPFPVSSVLRGIQIYKDLRRLRGMDNGDSSSKPSRQTKSASTKGNRNTSYKDTKR